MIAWCRVLYHSHLSRWDALGLPNDMAPSFMGALGSHGLFEKYWASLLDAEQTDARTYREWLSNSTFADKSFVRSMQSTQYARTRRTKSSRTYRAAVPSTWSACIEGA